MRRAKFLFVWVKMVRTYLRGFADKWLTRGEESG
jgi:hypothetical protein